MKIKRAAAIVSIFMSTLVFTSFTHAENVPDVKYRTVSIEDVNIFYREAGDPSKPTVLLLHGFPTSSHMFRDLIPELAQDYHVVAPDYPGYGFSSMPDVAEFDYSFDNTARLMTEFVDEIGVDRFSVYLMDYGAPVGFRIASSQPERIESLIIQNGNAYDEGIDNNFWEPIKAYWADRKSVNKGLDNAFWKNVKAAYQQPNMTNDAALRFLTTLGATKWQYTNGVKNVEAVSPDTWGHVQPLLDREGNQDIQLQMFYSYGSNPPLYPAWQNYLRKHQPPTLIVWGDKDEIFPTAGAEPYKRDLKDVEYHLIDTGHFALESHGQEIADLMLDFLNRKVAKEASATVAKN
ncbi:MAG: pimeloyl-ACP methyl ester carboxylesterase [Candidatus Azotimanducaceae bacterium]|jgi:pimeloyl-ACP methyl ester carboxylesterase